MAGEKSCTGRLTLCVRVAYDGDTEKEADKMVKLTASQKRIVDSMKDGAFIRWSGIGVSGKYVLHIPANGGVADYETRTVPSAAMGALANSGLIKRDGLGRDCRWVFSA